MGEIVELSCPSSVEFDDHALALTARLSEVAVRSAKGAMKSKSNPIVEKRFIDVFEEIRETMEAIEEHITLLEENARYILDALQENELAYFEHSAKHQKLTVMSLIMRRCSTLRVRRFFTSRNGCKHLQDNDIVCLEMKDGAIACCRPKTFAGVAATAIPRRLKTDR